MRVDPNESRYGESDAAKQEFNHRELRSLRVLLRRLRFLEAKVRMSGGLAESESGGAAFAEWEMEALVFVLDELGFLEHRKTGAGK